MERKEIKSRIIKVLEEKVLMRKLTDIDENCHFGADGLGLDSINFLKFLAFIEKEFSVLIEENYWLYEKMDTIGKVIDYFYERS